MERALHERLVELGQTVASAESLTGGELASLLSRTPGASSSYVGGVVSYATELKVGLLGVDEATVRDFGVVSAECATEMATGVRRITNADWAISTTGVAGPSQQEDKAVGTVYVAIAGPHEVVVSTLHLDGDRAEIRRATCVAAVQALLEVLG